MQGVNQVQRSNAVGQTPSYLPDADPGRQGGNTYTGNSTEPTIQDYENFFGPSARDIKTDLQRFKRHGRWHLPDILKGPNPWLTDRIDGLITDATNSPFTTKILPYRYKEEVDGKIKWNVWNFDEGMASRVPYESAARTLQQSKRSFAGYMVRQGMAIVLEHNFMMTPKGRENFKNQLNQLIGSIQYTNDLDVHMALVLAPSYQKTMRERYYTLDKSPSQICREFVDLFGMMQKNVNALDILIEEGKAILRTWGGPMPDFLLCNSKLTFQMTMTPEKTNYITQGTDGVKRLRQGPDLGSYRGLSVIHSRSFAMEVGQHPRDVLRRRVRTAEYYRILPDKNNVNREFEFYNEERDTWFTLSFQELLRYARHPHDDRGDTDNPAAVDRVFNMLSGSAGKEKADSRTMALALPQISRHPMLKRRAASSSRPLVLGASPQTGELSVDEASFVDNAARLLESFVTNGHFPLFLTDVSFIDGTYEWALKTPRYDMGIKHIMPKDNRVWDAWTAAYDQQIPGGANLPQKYAKSLLSLDPTLSREGVQNLYHNLKNVTLNDPFQPNNQAPPGTASWYSAFAFYVEMYQRSGFPISFFDSLDIGANPVNPFYSDQDYNNLAANLRIKQGRFKDTHVDISSQILHCCGGNGSVNHPLFLGLQYASNEPELQQALDLTNGMSSRILLTYEIIAPLIRQYNIQGVTMTGIDYMLRRCNDGIGSEFGDLMQEVFDSFIAGERSMIETTIAVFPPLKSLIDSMFSSFQIIDPAIDDTVFFARNGIHTWPMGLTSISHPFHPIAMQGYTDDTLDFFKRRQSDLQKTFNHMNMQFLAECKRYLPNWDDADQCFWARDICLPAFISPPVGAANFNGMAEQFWSFIQARLTLAPINLYEAHDSERYMQNMPYNQAEARYFANIPNREQAVYRIANKGLESVSINMDSVFHTPTPPVVPRGAIVSQDQSRLQDVEIVIVRPNIEHNMLGVIMGLGGESLGNTLWGQTELSVYDDSMHGIWGMSYKYHERAIVFNEKNLIRLWDIAYDGYNGGKDDTYVDWLNPDAPNGYQNFKELTLDVSKNYRGPSMMVMAFVHDREKRDVDGLSLYDKHFRRNWPSPIVFHDSRAGVAGHGSQKETLPVDYDNLQVIDVDDFRVFNNQLYSNSYEQYRNMMPHFHEMHLMRKTAGQSSADSETHTDSLAFQGSMKIKQGGIILQEIHGSGHHGPDYTGIASVRAGKGQKTAGQAPTLHRLI